MRPRWRDVRLRLANSASGFGPGNCPSSRSPLTSLGRRQMEVEIKRIGLYEAGRVEVIGGELRWTDLPYSLARDMEPYGARG